MEVQKVGLYVVLIPTIIILSYLMVESSNLLFTK